MMIYRRIVEPLAMSRSGNKPLQKIAEAIHCRLDCFVVQVSYLLLFPKIHCQVVAEP